MSLGGSGIARHEGLVIFVPFSAPGDLLKVQILNQKKNYAEAQILQIITPSQQRVQAPCEYYEKCGGCNWQHLSYDTQIYEKQNIVEEQLFKFLGRKLLVSKIVPSPKQWNYRNRINLKQKDGTPWLFCKGLSRIGPNRKMSYCRRSN
jgi:23S rRNA (uracil1939-C5)-methyltransferase